MKYLIKIGCLLCLLMIIPGCGSTALSEPMTSKEFVKTMEEKGFEIVDQTETASDNTYQSIHVAVDEEKYSFEYYFMKDENSAENVYKYAVQNLNNKYSKDKDAKINESNKKRISDYTVDASDYYCEVIIKENTVLFVTAYSNSKEEAKEIIDSLGY